MTMHKVFISFHHPDKAYKDSLIVWNQQAPMFIDGSVDTRDIPDGLPDSTIREKIRDEYLRDTSVTIVLVGLGTKGRKHVDWELYSSMFDGRVNARSGLLVILLPGANPGNCWTAAHENEKAVIYPDTTSWTSITTRAEYEARYPYMPDRILDNLVNKDAPISVVPWERLNRTTLPMLLENAFGARTTNRYDLRRAMRRANS